MLSINLNYLNEKVDLSLYRERIAAIDRSLRSKTCPGSEWTGWLTWPKDYDKDEFKKILRIAKEIRENYDTLVVCGIGGSYLGARAVIEALEYERDHRGPKIIFLGQTLASDHLAAALAYLKDRRFAINVISKSGTTLETAITFRFLKELLEAKLGKSKAAEAIYVTTDAKKGALRTLAKKNGYVTFDLPSDIGGRYSVFTPVGLLPLACAGIDIKAFMEGARQGMKDFGSPDIRINPAYQYAAIRHHEKTCGRQVELLVSYLPRLLLLAEWWKQLFGESEGKERHGLFPASATYTTDLHSLGQFIQDGTPLLFETIIHVVDPGVSLLIPASSDPEDGLDDLAGRTVASVQESAFLGTLSAHTKEGQVPNVIIEIERLDTRTLGTLLYFFMRACAASALLLGVNPFDQPGVEVYKKNMRSLLDQHKRAK